MKWRPLAEGEAATLAAACIQFDPYLTLGYRAATLENYLQRADPTLDRFAIETDEVLRGVLCLRRPWLRGPLIEMMALLPEAQGQGLGQAIVERCQAEAGKNLWATVSDFHLSARRFYQRLGFDELCELPELIEPQQAEILLRWRKM